MSSRETSIAKWLLTTGTLWRRKRNIFRRRTRRLSAQVWPAGAKQSSTRRPEIGQALC